MTPEDRIDEDEISIPEEEKKRILSALMKMMELGIGAVYGQEDEGTCDADVDCRAHIDDCAAKCCKLAFALTREEAERGDIKFDPARPFFIMHESDGYCSHFDRVARRCSIWNERPTRCRRYDCRTDASE